MDEEVIEAAIFGVITIVAVVYSVFILFSPAAKRKREQQAQDQVQAQAKRLENLSKAGIVPIDRKRKLSNLLMFAGAVTLAVLILTLVVLDSLFFGEAWFLFVGLVVGASLGLLFAIIAVSVADRAEEAGRSWMSFFWLSFLISPIITWLIAASLKPASASESAPAFAESRGDSLEEKLTELQGLKDKGILSQDEFDEAKRKALGI